MPSTTTNLPSDTRFFGSCLCQQVTFSVTAFSQQVANCYCSMCRKFHGAAYGTLVAVNGLQWHTGEAKLKHFQAHNGTTRSFCNNCGASIGFRPAGASLNEIEIAIALFDQDLPLSVDAQIYTEHKANWCRLDSTIKSFANGRDD